MLQKLRQNKLVLSILLVITLLILTLELTSFSKSLFSKDYQYGDPGTRDFIEYYSAYQLFKKDLNPYDPKLLLEVEKDLGWEEEKPLMMWNPPWTLTLLSPLFQLDFISASRIWFLLNIIFTFLAGILTWLALKNLNKTPDERFPLGCLLLIFFCYPVWDTIQLGQMSLLLTFALALFFWAQATNRNSLAGLALFLLTIKIHLTYLIFVYAFYLIVFRARYNLGISFFTWMLFFLGLLAIQSTSAVGFWIDSIINQPADDLAINLVSWKTATFVSFIRDLIQNFTGELPGWPMFMIPGVSTVIYLGLLLSSSVLGAVLALPLVTIFSIITSPFGWIFDQSLLIIPFVALICSVWHRRSKNLALYLLGALQIITIALKITILNSHHQFFWYPLVTLLIWVVVKTRDKKLTVR